MDINDIILEPSPLHLSTSFPVPDDALKAQLNIFVNHILKTSYNKTGTNYLWSCKPVYDAVKYFATRIEDLGGREEEVGKIIGRYVYERVGEKRMDKVAVRERVVLILKTKGDEAAFDGYEDHLEDITVDEFVRRDEERQMWTIVLNILEREWELGHYAPGFNPFA